MACAPYCKHRLATTKDFVVLGTFYLVLAFLPHLFTTFGQLCAKIRTQSAL